MYVVGLYIYERIYHEVIIHIRRPHIYNISLLLIFLREIITTRVRLLVRLAASTRNYWMVCI